jgi:hypothetical protein
LIIFPFIFLSFSAFILRLIIGYDFASCMKRNYIVLPGTIQFGGARRGACGGRHTHCRGADGLCSWGRSGVPVHTGVRRLLTRSHACVAQPFLSSAVQKIVAFSQIPAQLPISF